MKRQGIVGIYLAAGNSRRMGSNKLSLPIGNWPLGAHALHTAIHSELDHIVVVTKETEVPQWIPDCFLRSPLVNRWSQATCFTKNQSQSGSLRTGLKVADSMMAEAVVILLADQPLITVEMLQRLILEYRKSFETKEIQYVASIQQQNSQQNFHPPILFTEGCFSYLYGLEGDAGAGKLLREGFLMGQKIEYEDPWLFFDVDIPEDYKLLESLIRNQKLIFKKPKC